MLPRLSHRAKDTNAASTSEMARFETAALSIKEYLKHHPDVLGRWTDQVHQHRTLTKFILDLGRSVRETYGQQEGATYNGHFECTCYAPSFVFNQFGNLERVGTVRPWSGPYPGMKVVVGIPSWG